MNLYSKIETLRTIMHTVALEKGISHPDVLRISQTLDIIMNEYYEINIRLKNSS